MVLKHHGILREDPWRWLRERDNPHVIAHLEAENAYTEDWFTRTGDLRTQVYNELIGRLEQTNSSAVYPKDNYLYISRIREGEDYRSYYRRNRYEEGEWELYFDANREAKGASYFDLGFLDVSPDGKRMAYAVDTIGEESYTLKFRDLVSGEDLPVSIEETFPEGEWDASSSFYHYVMEDETRRPDRIYRYKVGENPESAQLVYTEEDSLFHVGICKSQDGKFLFASSESKETTEVHFMAADAEDGEFRLIFGRRTSIQYFADHHQGDFIIRTNENAPDFQLIQLPVGEEDSRKAQILADPQEGIRLNDVLVLKDFLLLFERREGLDRIRVLSLVTNEVHLIEMQDAVYELQDAVNAEYDTCHFNYTVSSPIRPPATFRYNLKTRETELLRRTKVPSGHEPDKYTTRRIHAKAGDGTRIPVTVVTPNNLRLDGSATLYLYGYGAYGESVECGFHPAWLTWLERGHIVAIAHVRGGGLLGEHWYQAGKLEHKENSFSDFIDCAEFLIEKGYTRAGGILVEGGSAGGLLVGTVLNRKPGLFRAAVASVPFVDVVNTMLDPSLPLTTIEYEEWGNPDDPEVFRRILAYSPYDNVHDATYPPILATAGLNDSRVPYWEAAKWVARLRKHQKGNGPILLKTNMETGHSGASGRYAFWKEIATEQAFLLQAGIMPPSKASNGNGPA